MSDQKISICLARRETCYFSELSALVLVYMYYLAINPPPRRYPEPKREQRQEVASVSIKVRERSSENTKTISQRTYGRRILQSPPPTYFETVFLVQSPVQQ